MASDDSHPNLIPYQFRTFFPENPLINFQISPLNTNEPRLLHTQKLRVSLLDAPFPSNEPIPPIGTLIVPYGREKDPLFTTEEGQLYLLTKYFNLSRLILVGNNPAETDPKPFNLVCSLRLKKEELDILHSVLRAYCPEDYLEGDIRKIHFVTYSDEVVHQIISQETEGPPAVGVFVTERVQIALPGGMSEGRVRLRLKSCPQFIQMEVRTKLVNQTYEVDRQMLVDDYSNPMIAGLSLASGHLSIPKPRCLCIGFCVGPLMDFLGSHLKFQIAGIDHVGNTNEWKIAKYTLGRLVDSDKYVDPLNFIKKRSESVMSKKNQKVTTTKFRGSAPNSTTGKFEVIVLSINVPRKRAPLGICSPPLEYISVPVLTNMKNILENNGILMIDVSPPNYIFHEQIIKNIKKVFEQVFEYQIMEKKRFILYATKTRNKDATGYDGKNIMETILLMVPRSTIAKIVEI